jgi:UDP-2-acetamido-3-amino-2,3-dideoxy-glucuronate N-acetyltransferase
MRAQFLELQRIEQPRGDLAIGELGAGLPFAPQRFFIVHDIPRGVERGGHAHRALEQLLVAVAGAVLVRTRDAEGEGLHLLEQPWHALYVPPMVWTEQSFSPGARLLVLASAGYEEADYIRDRGQFEHLIRGELPQASAA